MAKHSKTSHKHKPAVERTLPIERIVELFSRRFEDPYLNPTAELTFEDFVTAFPDISGDALEEALTYWTSHSGEKLLQTKTIEGTKTDVRVWYIHGLMKHFQWSSPVPNPLESRG